MTDPVESAHKRSKSSALSLLRSRRDGRDDDNVESHTLMSPATTAHSPTFSTTPSQPTLGHSSRKFTSTPGLMRSASAVHSRPTATMSPDKTMSIEQTVRKFKIFEALKNGDTAAISKAIRESDGSRMSISSFSTVSTNLEDTTILHLAIQCAEQQVIEYVLSDGAGTIDINARDRDGNTALHLAASLGRGPIVRLLLGQPGINDSLPNYAGRLPLDLARTPDIFQQLQLSRSIFVESKIKQIQELVAQGDYKSLGEILEESRVKTVLDINGGEFTSDPMTVHAGGTLLHEAARKKNIELIQAMLKKSPAAVAAQRGIQEKAVLGNASQQGVVNANPSDALAGKEGREMQGYLKKWNELSMTQGRLVVVQSICVSQSSIWTLQRRPSLRLLESHLSSITSKQTMKLRLRGGFGRSIILFQWTKDQAKEEERQEAKRLELLQQAKEHSGNVSKEGSDNNGTNEPSIYTESRRESIQAGRLMPQSGLGRMPSQRVAFTSNAGSVGDDEETNYGSYNPSFMGEGNRVSSYIGTGPVDGDDEEYGDGSSEHETPASKDAFEITAQSAQLQLEIMGQVNAALQVEQSRNPNLVISDPVANRAIATYDSAIRNLKGLVGDLLKISKDRDSYWQHRLDREEHMRQMWEESMAQVAREQDDLMARMGESEEKRKLTKRALREVTRTVSRPDSRGELVAKAEIAEALEEVSLDDEGVAPLRHTMMTSFFDAVDAGQVEVVKALPPSSSAVAGSEEVEESQLVKADGLDISSAFKGYENGVRTRLKMDADDRPKISLWGILKSMIGKDMTKMTLPVSFNEPTSLLYRCGEDMEYADLLDIAADRADSIERMVYVAAFASSEYASTIDRVAKPFNPLLGETFEYVRPDKNYRFFIEQVSHHPPIGAAWAESPKWTYYGESAVKSKFYGKSFDINPLGTWFLKLRPTAGGPEELYTWKKVTSSVIGIITGNPVVDNYGPMEIKNWTTGEVCNVEFKARGWKASSAYHITGRVNDANGQTRFSLGGLEEPKSGSSNSRGNVNDPSQAFLVWEANPRPAGIPFNLTPFVLTFNDINDNLRPWLPPTDSRLRPDQRAMEDGERREREQAGEVFTPQWFEKSKCPITGEEYWAFNDKYWSEREKAATGEAWKDVEDIFSDVKEED
ncbi:hypothetical protein DID88_003055 [Monilinia fructigena]|uniref:Uncharacterized protein n=1 Tax=Monilinia fructigena TaxID=38457 RepID=A0A395IK27_9HELO|nr:hypothetical protein DID88_003055 [Monilinia fructigena]